MKFGVIHGLVILVACCALTACEAPGPAASAPADSTQALLGSLRQDALRSAFEQLPAYAYMEHVRTEQLAPGGEVVAFREQVLQHRPQDGGPAVQVLASNATGAFDLGLLGRFASAEPEHSGNAGQDALHLIPEDPPYLSPRTRHAFRYEFRPDTVLNGAAVSLLEVTASGEDGEEQTIRNARVFFDPASREIVALSLTRENPAFLFEERTRTHVRILRNAEGEWVPDSTSVLTHIDMPAGTGRTFRISRRYEDFSMSR